jgi:hypothetical protein
MIFPERLERGGGPCWLLKLRWMGTQRVQMKGVLPWLVRGLVNSIVPIAHQAGHAAVLGRLSLSRCLWKTNANAWRRWATHKTVAEPVAPAVVFSSFWAYQATTRSQHYCNTYWTWTLYKESFLKCFIFIYRWYVCPGEAPVSLSPFS